MTHKATLNIDSVTMPAGKYWVGDPCYAVADAQWIPWLEAANYERQPFPGYLLADIDGRPVLGINTQWGDGEYFDGEMNRYPVDAGLIGVVPVEVATAEVNGSRLVDFEAPFSCSFDEGVITLGHIVIDTDPATDEEDPFG